MKTFLVTCWCVAALAANAIAQSDGAVSNQPAAQGDSHPWIDVPPPLSDRERKTLVDADHQHDGPQCEVFSIGIRDEESPLAPRAGPLTINSTFGSGVTAARQLVLQQAINEWQAVVQESGSTPGSYPITFTFSSFGGGSSALASTTTTYNTGTGNLISATMGFNTDYSWYVDPTPADDSEFTGGSPPAGYDLLTVARHELGHALGWVIGPLRITNLSSGNTFDWPRLNIPYVTASGMHVDPAWMPNDVMVPTIGVSTRRSISLYPTAAMVARAYEYLIPMRFVDAAYTGTGTGSANQPYRYTDVAASNAPAQIPLLLSNATHHTLLNYPFSTARFFYTARGGAFIVAP